MLIIGDKELEAGNVAVRSRDAGDLGALPLDKFLADITEEIRTRKSH
ncbi:MAG TPA: His/Gly/Thr/Pro-type tRNA ligase C-terminal domain-containing protein [Bacillota bacterium]|nr:His/Gly/Thr/Pro-type tRNA ligase C-terminal domain-containing protein [Bacillota bacterium]